MLHGCARTGHYFSPKDVFLPDSTVDVPIRFDGAYVLAEVSVNRKGPYQFLLDTGAGMTLVSSEVAEELDPRRIDDPLYFLQGDDYVPIDAALYARFEAGDVTM